MLSLHQCGDQLITWVGSDAVCLCRARRSGIETSGVGSVGHRRRADKRSLIRFDAEHSTSGVRPQEQSVCPHKRRLRVSAVRRVVIVGHRRRADTLRALLPPARLICRLTLRVSERVTEHRLMRLS